MKMIIRYLIMLALIIISLIAFNMMNPINLYILNVKSGSMQPILNINDKIIVKEESNYNIGDIITYQNSDNVLVTHRIIEKHENTFITKGDSNNSEDLLPITVNAIKGKVIIIIKQYTLKLVIIVFLIVFIIIILKGKDL